MQGHKPPSKNVNSCERTEAAKEVSGPLASSTTLQNLAQSQALSEMINQRSNLLLQNQILDMLMRSPLAYSEQILNQEIFGAMLNPFTIARNSFTDIPSLLGTASSPWSESLTSQSNIHPPTLGLTLNPDLYRALYPSFLNALPLGASNLVVSNVDDFRNHPPTDQESPRGQASRTEAARQASLSLPKIPSMEAQDRVTHSGQKTKHGSETDSRGTKKQKKSKEMPTRPRTAYNFFFQDEREKLLRQIQDGKTDNDSTSHSEGVDAEYRRKPEKNAPEDDDSQSQKKLSTKRNPKRPEPHGLIGFQELGKIIGQKWQNISPETKARYRHRAECDRQRYATEMEQWKQREQEKLTQKQAELERMVDLKTRENYLKQGGGPLTATSSNS
jgi:hypothetical protein